jgi:hypothetical protein
VIKNEDLILGQISLAPLKRSYPAKPITSYKETLRDCRKVFLRDFYLALVLAGVALVAGLALVFAAGMALALPGLALWLI